MIPEVDQARAEDPGFAEVLARCHAKAQGVAYNPKIHGPFDAKAPPRREREKAKTVNIDQELAKIMERFEAKSPPTYRPKLVKDTPTRPGVEKVRNL